MKRDATRTRRGAFETKAGDGRVPRCGEIDEKSQSRRFCCCFLRYRWFRRLFPLVLLSCSSSTFSSGWTSFVALVLPAMSSSSSSFSSSWDKNTDIDHRRCRRRRWWCVGHEELLSRPGPAKKRQTRSRSQLAGRSTRRDTRASHRYVRTSFSICFSTITVAFLARKILSIRRIASASEQLLHCPRSSDRSRHARLLRICEAVIVESTRVLLRFVRIPPHERSPRDRSTVSLRRKGCQREIMSVVCVCR